VGVSSLIAIRIVADTAHILVVDRVVSGVPSTTQPKVSDHRLHTNLDGPSG